MVHNRVLEEKIILCNLGFGYSSNVAASTEALITKTPRILSSPPVFNATRQRFIIWDRKLTEINSEQ